MPKGLLGRKLGMTRIFDDKGAMVTVTVIEAGPCAVLQVKTEKEEPTKKGYRAIQLGFAERFTPEQWTRLQKLDAEKKRRTGNWKDVTQPELGHLKKTGKGASPKRFIREVLLEAGETYEAGQKIGVEVLEGWKVVDIIGTSKGRGTQGTIRRHHFKRGPASHGTKNIRGPGSVGQKTFPGRTHKGQRMYGHMGAARATVKNLPVVKIDKEKNLLLVEGGIPGPTGGFVVIRKATCPKIKREVVQPVSAAAAAKAVGKK
jgi:large subunit ribosomal protein L3